MIFQRVLTAELIDNACKISDLTSLNKQKISIKEVDKKLFEVFAKQIFTTGFVHAGECHWNPLDLLNLIKLF